MSEGAGKNPPITDKDWKPIYKRFETLMAKYGKDHPLITPLRRWWDKVLTVHPDMLTLKVMIKKIERVENMEQPNGPK